MVSSNPVVNGHCMCKNMPVHHYLINNGML